MSAALEKKGRGVALEKGETHTMPAILIDGTGRRKGGGLHIIQWLGREYRYMAWVKG